VGEAIQEEGIIIEDIIGVIQCSPEIFQEI